MARCKVTCSQVVELITESSLITPVQGPGKTDKITPKVLTMETVGSDVPGAPSQHIKHLAGSPQVIWKGWISRTKAMELYLLYWSRKTGIGFSWLWKQLSWGGSTCLSCDGFARNEIWITKQIPRTQGKELVGKTGFLGTRQAQQKSCCARLPAGPRRS